VSLIKEINDLRREMKIARTQVHDLEAALGLHRKGNQPGQNSEMMQQIMSSNKNAQLEKDLEESRKVVDIQKQEIVKLRNEIHMLEMGVLSRPPSGNKLQPISAQ
jgi:CO dehydrogenase nickel-insertion accessory protein CooC1